MKELIDWVRMFVMKKECFGSKKSGVDLWMREEWFDGERELIRGFGDE